MGRVNSLSMRQTITTNIRLSLTTVTNRKVLQTFNPNVEIPAAEQPFVFNQREKRNREHGANV